MRARVHCIIAASLLAVGSLAGCGGGELDLSGRSDRATPAQPAQPGAPTVLGPRWYECQGSEQAFVRRAHLAVLGRRPAGQAEVNVWTDLLAAFRAHDPAPPPAPDALGSEAPPSRRLLLGALARDPEYASRWLDFYRDALRVQRLDVQANPFCYDSGVRKGEALTSLAALVRDQPPETLNGDGLGPFTLHDLLLSSLRLDDVSPIYTANIFSMLARSYSGANADPIRRELARRGEFGAWFGDSYLHRDGVCLGCHNSEFSVTASDDPASSRFFPLPGQFEKSLFGSSEGPAPLGEHDSITRIQAVLRFTGFADQGTGVQPWGMDTSCGIFTPQAQMTDDPAMVDARFGDLTGYRATAWGLAASLQRGFRKLREHGLTRGPDGLIPDPDESFAYLVAANVAERVWREAVGFPLTIALYFPRNAAARDQLALLTESFIASGFSHQQLLLTALQSPAFNMLPPSAGCGAAPYEMPPLFDPWTTADSDPDRRGNGPGDAVASLSSRTLLRATRGAMRWSSLYDQPFPPSRESVEADFQAEVGVFLRNVEPGFQGFDFQALLAWEGRTGGCEKPPGATLDTDVVDLILDEATRHPDAAAADVVLALKDQLLGDPRWSSDAERAATSMLVGDLAAPASAVTPEALRAVCGAMLSSAPFLLHGLAPADAREAPALTPPSSRYREACQRIADRGLPAGWALTCGDDSLRVTTP